MTEQRLTVGELAESAYQKACKTSRPDDWLEAALLLRQHRDAILSADREEPITVEAVAEIVTRDDLPELSWLVEGGIHALPEGTVLVFAHRPITDENGSGEVYAATPSTPQPAPEWWMIECRNGFTGWWDGREKVDCRFFDKDPNKGYRFASKEDAERVITTRGNSCMIATSHQWIATPQPDTVQRALYDEPADLSSPESQPDTVQVPPGYRLLKNSTHEERSWPEDAGHENGNYSNACCECLRMFTGHKRRVACRSCTGIKADAAAPSTPQPAPEITAKPLVWTQDGNDWHDECGFYIMPAADDLDYPWSACWGEGDPETFATLEEAKVWCQKVMNAWIRERGQLATLRAIEEWHEDDGNVTWWVFPVNEPAWIGQPSDSDWPGYHTHWTPHPQIPPSPKESKPRHRSRCR